jgi:hypothetical protein
VEWTLKLNGREARYGFDAERGCWAEAVHTGAVVSFDAIEAGFDCDWPMLAILYFMADWGLIDADSVNEAFELLTLAPVCRGPLRRGVRRVLKIVSNLERAAG